MRTLEDCLRLRRFPQERERAAQSLAQLAGMDAMPILQHYTADSDQGVRAQARYLIRYLKRHHRPPPDDLLEM